MQAFVWLGHRIKRYRSPLRRLSGNTVRLHGLVGKTSRSISRFFFPLILSSIKLHRHHSSSSSSTSLSKVTITHETGAIACKRGWFTLSLRYGSGVSTSSIIEILLWAGYGGFLFSVLLHVSLSINKGGLNRLSLSFLC